jgi:lipopolysaccharide transport system ATP-binding protein
LLKILAGIATPTSGSVSVSGTVAAILELGMGFHPEFTGRGNIGLMAALMGLSAADVTEKMPGIIEFSELGHFVDRPVKTYSTGMAMRLAFAIATEVDPEILIVDEALSVGDGYFQKKCMDRLLRFVDEGGTLLFCSHAMYYVSSFCRQVLWLKDGRPAALGPAADVVRQYDNYLVERRKDGQEQEKAAREKEGSSDEPGPARLRKVELVGKPGGGPATYVPGEDFVLEIAWETDSPDRSCHLAVGLDRQDGVQVAAFATHRDGQPAYEGSRSYEARLNLPALSILNGEFTLWVFLMDEAGLHLYDQYMSRRSFVLESPDYRVGLVDLPHHWEEPL